MFHQTEHDAIAWTGCGIAEQQVTQTHTIGNLYTEHGITKTTVVQLAHPLTCGCVHVVVIITLKDVVDHGGNTKHWHTGCTGNQSGRCVDTGNLLHGGFAYFGVLVFQRIPCSLKQHVVHGHAIALVHEKNFTQRPLSDTRRSGGGCSTIGKFCYVHCIVSGFLLGLGIKGATLLAHLIEFQLVSRDQCDLSVHAFAMMENETGSGIDLGQQVVLFAYVKNVVNL